MTKRNPLKTGWGFVTTFYNKICAKCNRRYLDGPLGRGFIDVVTCSRCAKTARQNPHDDRSTVTKNTYRSKDYFRGGPIGPDEISVRDK